MSVQAISGANFEEEVVQSSVPVLVDVWAKWCGPCRAMAPIVESLSESYGPDQLKVVKIDIDEATENHNLLVNKLGVRGLPTLLLFKDGKVAGSDVGYHGRDHMVQWLAQTLNSAAAPAAAEPVPPSAGAAPEAPPADKGPDATAKPEPGPGG